MSTLILLAIVLTNLSSHCGCPYIWPSMIMMYNSKRQQDTLVNDVGFRLTYTSLLVVYMPLCNASGAVHLIGSFFVCFIS